MPRAIDVIAVGLGGDGRRLRELFVQQLQEGRAGVHEI